MPPLFRIIDEFDPLRVLVQVSVITDENLRIHLDELLAMMAANHAGGRRNVVVIDASFGMRPSAAQLEQQADWIHAHRELLGASCLGIAFVIPSPLVRGALAAIFWIAQLPIPHTVHATLGHAIDWASARLDESGIPVPAPLRMHGAAALALEVADVRATAAG